MKAPSNDYCLWAAFFSRHLTTST